MKAQRQLEKFCRESYKETQDIRWIQDNRDVPRAAQPAQDRHCGTGVRSARVIINAPPTRDFRTAIRNSSEVASNVQPVQCRKMITADAKGSVTGC